MCSRLSVCLCFPSCSASHSLIWMLGYASTASLCDYNSCRHRDHCWKRSRHGRWDLTCLKYAPCMFTMNSEIYLSVLFVRMQTSDLRGKKKLSPALTQSTAGLVCPKCGTAKISGRLSCCARGGAWFHNCGDSNDSNFDHTWVEGIQACESTFPPVFVHAYTYIYIYIYIYI